MGVGGNINTVGKGKQPGRDRVKTGCPFNLLRVQRIVLTCAGKEGANPLNTEGGGG